MKTLNEYINESISSDFTIEEHYPEFKLDSKIDKRVTNIEDFDDDEFSIFLKNGFHLKVYSDTDTFNCLFYNEEKEDWEAVNNKKLEFKPKSGSLIKSILDSFDKWFKIGNFPEWYE